MTTKITTEQAKNLGVQIINLPKSDILCEALFGYNTVYWIIKNEQNSKIISSLIRFNDDIYFNTGEPITDLKPPSENLIKEYEQVFDGLLKVKYSLWLKIDIIKRTWEEFIKELNAERK